VSGRIVVLAAPSGAGKTTIANELVSRRPERFGFSVSATTRSPRAGETDGVAYFFLTRGEFERRVRAGDFLEWAEYAGERYGTLRHEVERVRAGGRHVVLDIEVHGATQVRRAYPYAESVIIFVVPPSPRVLIERLRNRRTESEQELKRRLEIAVREVKTVRDDRPGDVFDYILVNDDLDQAVERIIVTVEHPDSTPRRQSGAVNLAEFVRQLEAEAHQLNASV
jgi:guanylate kinase